MAAPRARPRRRYPANYAPGHTARKGLGTEHQADRKTKIARLAASPGQPCPRPWCGHAPMYATPEEAARAGLPRKLWNVELDHFPGRAYGGPQTRMLSHAFCNRKSGQLVGAAIRRAARAQGSAGYDRW
jgi:hypothetical protein